MNRKSFLTTAIVAGSTGSVVSALAQPSLKKGMQKKHSTEFYELRVYTLKNETQQKLVEDYLQNAAIPALNKLGSKNIGVFTELKPAEQTKVYVLIPYLTMEDFLNVQEKLSQDKNYKEAGVAYLTAPATAPAYDRIESSLLQAFTQMPKLQTPGTTQRIFELRRYESASELTSKKKIEMFNEGGEIQIFKRLNFKPVFYAETLIGTFRPNLTYMVTFDNMEDHDAKWKNFGGDPEWKRISSMPEYSDAKNISRITSTMLAPTAYSQI